MPAENEHSDANGTELLNVARQSIKMLVKQIWKNCYFELVTEQEDKFIHSMEYWWL